MEGADVRREAGHTWPPGQLLIPAHVREPRVTAPIIPISVCVCPGPPHNLGHANRPTQATAAAAQQMFDQKLCGPVLGQLSPYGQTWATNLLPPVACS